MELQYVDNLYKENQQLKKEVKNLKQKVEKLKNELFSETLQSLELLLQNKKLKEHACNSIDYCMYPCNKYYEWFRAESKKESDD